MTVVKLLTAMTKTVRDIAFLDLLFTEYELITLPAYLFGVISIPLDN